MRPFATLFTPRRQPCTSRFRPGSLVQVLRDVDDGVFGSTLDAGCDVGVVLVGVNRGLRCIARAVRSTRV